MLEGPMLMRPNPSFSFPRALALSWLSLAVAWRGLLFSIGVALARSFSCFRSRVFVSRSVLASVCGCRVHGNHHLDACYIFYVGILTGPSDFRWNVCVTCIDKFQVTVNISR